MDKDEQENSLTASSKYHVTSAEIDLETVEIDAAVADMSKFSVLYSRYYTRIFRFIFQRLADEDLAADVTSRVFLRAMTNLKNYKHRGYPFASWLYRIARNEINQEFRKERTERVYQAYYSDIAELTSEIQEKDDDGLQKKLVAALKKLKAPEMELIEMRFFEKRSFKEIGEIMDVTENNAKVKMFRVIQRLKKLMNV